MLCVGISEIVIGDLAEFLGALPAAELFDSAGGVRQDADIDTVLIHHVEIFAMIEGMQSGAARIVLRFGQQFEILCRGTRENGCR